MLVFYSFLHKNTHIKTFINVIFSTSNKGHYLKNLFIHFFYHLSQQLFGIILVIRNFAQERKSQRYAEESMAFCNVSIANISQGCDSRKCCKSNKFSNVLGSLCNKSFTASIPALITCIRCSQLSIFHAQLQ